MNYNANSGGPRPATFSKKHKRVSDVNAMGYNPYNNAVSQQPNVYLTSEVPLPVGGLPQGYGAQTQIEGQAFTNITTAPNFTPIGPQSQQQYPPQYPISANLGILGPLGQPVVQDMAMQYGQQLAGAGKTMLKNEVEKYISVGKLKYYFAVDTKYVVTKLGLLFFPFTHSDWSVKYEQDVPVQPRFEINAPDLYIPTMAYITYILVAGLVLGIQNKFSPAQIGITASSALAWCIIELLLYSIILYILQVKTSLKTFDLLAYSGYKFVGTIMSILISLLAGKTGFYVTLIYTSLSLAFFLVRSLKVQVLTEHHNNSKVNNSYYGTETTTSTTGHKRRLYFLLFIAGAQMVLSWWLSFHLVHSGDLTKVI